MSFSDLGLNERLVDKCDAQEFFEPTPIQEKAIPIVLTGEDLIGCAETGTGKTAAFLLPCIQRVSESNLPGVKVLIVAPTRELISQIKECYHQFEYGGQKCVSLIGGANMKKQINAIKNGVDFVFATPGRLIDHIERGLLDLSTVNVLILDEADRMLDMGFLPSIRRILKAIPKERQSLLFSATMADSVKTLAYSVMSDPKIVEVSPQNKTATNVRETIYPVGQASKTPLLVDLLEKENLERVIVFTKTKRGADRLSHILAARGLPADTIHSDRSQAQREKVLKEFKDGKISILVATDIASRGIDVDSVSHVINYDVPEPPEDYVHRVGRTGRAGNIGQAITFVTPLDKLLIRDIEMLTEDTIERFYHPEFGSRKPNQAVKKTERRKRKVTKSFKK